MKDDPIVALQIKEIENNEFAREIWEEVISKPVRKYNDLDIRKIVFKLKKLMLLLIILENHYIEIEDLRS